MKVFLKNPITILVLFFSVVTQSQQAIVPAGGNAVGSNGTVSYTIGQVTFTTADNSNFSVAQGVQQPYEISILDVGDHNYDSIQLKVYPNPTPANVILEITPAELEGFAFQLFDNLGKLILKGDKITSIQTKINFEGLPSSVYYLEVTNNNKHLKTFKIIKN